MKKLKFLAITLMALVAVFALCACGGDKLSAPELSGFDVSEENLLTWKEVPNAYSYVVEIKNVDTGEVITKKPKKESQSLSELEEGDYEIKVMSIARGDDFKNSDWSEALNFHKDYETGCIYTLTNNRTEYAITKVGKASGVVEIEAVYRNKPVTSIGDAAFRGSTRITEVIVGPNVRTIGESAFYNCTKLTRVVLPDSLTFIGEKAFSSCQVLTEINLPDSLTSIPSFAFAYCRALDGIQLHSDILSIGESAFKSCTALTEVTIPDSVESIGADAFADCKLLESISFGSGLTAVSETMLYGCDVLETVSFAEDGALEIIGEDAINSCSALKQITIPEGVTEIRAGAFQDCEALETVSIPETITKVGYLSFSGTKTYNTQIEQTGFAYVGNWIVAADSDTLSEIEKINDEVLNEGTVGIADYAFYYAGKQLYSVTLPKSVKYIGVGAFAYCEGLVEANLSKSGVVKIYPEAFSNCLILNQLSLNDGLEIIDQYAFVGCALLSNRANNARWIPDSVTEIGSYAFKDTAIWQNPDESGVVYADKWIVGYNTESLGTVTVRNGTIGVANYAFVDCTTLQAISNIDEATIIGRGAFYGCETLGTVQLSDDLIEIKDYTFYGCKGLRSVGLPARLKTIGRSAFYKCENLNVVDLSAGKIESIGQYAFFGCTNLIDLTISEDMTEIPDYAFYKCSFLESVTIPDGIKKIGLRAFYSCAALTELDLGKVEYIGERAFYGCGELTKIVIPNTVETIDSYAFYKCAKASELTIGNSVSTIGAYAFYGIESLKTLKIPQNVKSIGNYAFKGATSMNSVIIRFSLQSVGAHAFYGWTKASLYVETNPNMANWNARWNSGRRPMVSGCTLSEDGSYVVSVAISEKSVMNVNERNPLSPPIRRGYTFEGWAYTADAVTPDLTLDQIAELQAGTTVYAVWAPINI